MASISDPQKGPGPGCRTRAGPDAGGAPSGGLFHRQLRLQDCRPLGEAPSMVSSHWEAVGLPCSGKQGCVPCALDCELLLLTSVLLTCPGRSPKMRRVGAGCRGPCLTVFQKWNCQCQPCLLRGFRGGESVSHACRTVSKMRKGSASEIFGAVSKETPLFTCLSVNKGR